MSLDQRVSNDVALFARYGIRDGNVSKFDQAATVGGQIIENGWRRANDIIGVAYGLSKTSGKYKDNSLALDGYEAKGDEQYIEAYYRYWANTNDMGQTPSVPTQCLILTDPSHIILAKNTSNSIY